MAPLILDVFPNSRFIHQHRDFRDVLVSTINKTVFPDWMDNSERLRYASRLAGDKNLSAVERTCHYWDNINARILEDLKDQDFLSLPFSDLINGKLRPLETFLGVNLDCKVIEPVNTKKKITKEVKEFNSFDDLPRDWQKVSVDICGDTMRKLGYEIT